MQRVLSFFRLFLALAVVSLEVLICLPGLLLLLPSRAARARFTCRCANLFGLTTTTIIGVRTRWMGPSVDAVFPAVFVSNHSSSLDFFVLMKHVPTNTCSVGKKELVFLPFIGLFYALAGHLLIDRKNRESAHASLAIAATFVKKHNMAIWLAPEGTRSRDGRLGSFKKGFVHTAIATGLPVIPVVLHGCPDLWPMGSWVIKPGTIHIEALEPIDTSAWRSENAHQHAELVRSRVETCLSHFQQPPPNTSLRGQTPDRPS